MKSILRKSGLQAHGKFVSPSMASDIKEAESHSFFDWKKAGGLLLGALILKRYPRAALWGVFAAGVVAGLAVTRSGRVIFRETLSTRPDLH